MRTRRIALFLIAIACLPVGAQRAQAQPERPSGSAWAAKKSGWQLLTPAQRTEAGQFAEDFKSYLRVAKTAMLSTREVVRLAKAAGFVEFTDAAQVKPG